VCILLKIKKNNIMDAIIAGIVFCVFALGLFIYDHTEAGKKFFGSDN
jgi:hypothetical protein